MRRGFGRSLRGSLLNPEAKPSSASGQVVKFCAAQGCLKGCTANVPPAKKFETVAPLRKLYSRCLPIRQRWQLAEKSTSWAELSINGPHPRFRKLTRTRTLRHFWHLSRKLHCFSSKCGLGVGGCAGWEGLLWLPHGVASSR